MEGTMEDTSATLPTLTAQQMLEKCIVPVKAEFLVRKKPAPKKGDVADAPAAAEGAATEATATATMGQQKQDREQEQSKSKSRKQMRKDFRAGRPAELCTNFALGRCTYGDKCRFSHDLKEYVTSKPADLPGTCPWTAVRATCPYGITCRYARTHGSDDDLHRTLATVLAEKEEATGGVGGDAAAAATEAAAGPGADGAGAAPTPEAPCALPLPTSIEKETNVLSKDVQTLLWKNRYDFSRSDGILKSMDLRISFKHQPKPMPGGGGGGGKKGARGGSQQQQQQQGGQPAGPESAGEAVAKAVAEGAVAAADVKEADPKAEMEVDGAAQAGAAADAPAPAPAPPLEEDGPAAKRQRTEDATAVTAAAPPASDAAAVAALASEPRPEEAATAGGDRNGPTGRSAAAVSEARAAHVELPVRPCERRRLDFRGKSYLAPLTTVGNLPFRRVCKGLGVDVTCGEMALATNLLQGQASEWALMKRHPCEDFFGVQVCGGYPDALARVGQLLGEQLTVDFVDINMGCPIDLVCDKNAGSALLRQPRRIEQILRATSAALEDTPLTFKTRKGFNDGEDVAHTFLHKAGGWGAAAVTLHGRTRQQRYSRLADWGYIQRCGESCASAGLQLIGNGDVFSYLDWNAQMEGAGGHLAALMVGRGALIKPWIFTEIKEQRHWDISASERLDLYKQFCSTGLEHWGSDSRGVETTRRFLLEWLSFTCRYVPVGLLEVVPQQMNHRPPVFCGRSDLETLMASEEPQDWVRISEMLLGPPPAPISFTAKHKSNSYAAPGAGSELDMARG